MNKRTPGIRRCRAFIGVYDYFQLNTTMVLWPLS